MARMTKEKDKKREETAESRIQGWLTELQDAEKREKDWRKEGCRITDIYEAEKRSENSFNILYSNTETLAPALYNNLPRPVVQRRYKDEDATGKMAAKVTQRTLEYLLDNAVGTYAPFDTLMEQAVLESLVPGRGITRFKYDATFVEVEEPAAAEEGAEEEGVAHEKAEKVSYETVCGEHVPWDRFKHGYAKRWSDVPWISFEHFMTREELIKNFGEDIGNAVQLDVCGSESGDDKSEKVKDAQGATLARVEEIWDKVSKKVYFLAPSMKERFLKEVEDPLELSGFFPLPRPLVLFNKISSLVPRPLYAFYEEQAKELNRVTIRINKIIDALKVRGFYNGELGDLAKVLESEDNTLVPAENVAVLMQGQHLDNQIWLMPLEKLINVLQQLYVQRQQVKTVIYEITGISDILRGASVASETATAQNIKNQWGTLRLKKSQKRVMGYVRESLRIMAEIAVTKLSKGTLRAMTGMAFPSMEEKQQAMVVMQQATAAQQEPPPGAAAAAQLPSWEELEALLTNDLQRNYRIDIETNSTVDAEATEDKQNMGEFLNAIAQFLNGAGPLVQQGILPFEAAKGILLAVTRRYRFGSEVEDELKKMQAPKPQGEGDDGTKAKAEMEVNTMQAESAAKMEMLQMDKAVKDAETKAKMADIQRKEELAMAQHAQKMQQIRLTMMQQAAGGKSGGNTTP